MPGAAEDSSIWVTLTDTALALGTGRSNSPGKKMQRTPEKRRGGVEKPVSPKRQAPPRPRLYRARKQVLRVQSGRAAPAEGAEQAQVGCRMALAVSLAKVGCKRRQVEDKGSGDEQRRALKIMRLDSWPSSVQKGMGWMQGHLANICKAACFLVAWKLMWPSASSVHQQRLPAPAQLPAFGSESPPKISFKARRQWTPISLTAFQPSEQPSNTPAATQQPPARGGELAANASGESQHATAQQPAEDATSCCLPAAATAAAAETAAQQVVPASPQMRSQASGADSAAGAVSTLVDEMATSPDVPHKDAQTPQSLGDGKRTRDAVLFPAVHQQPSMRSMGSPTNAQDPAPIAGTAAAAEPDQPAVIACTVLDSVDESAPATDALIELAAAADGLDRLLSAEVLTSLDCHPPEDGCVGSTDGDPACQPVSAASVAAESSATDVPGAAAPKRRVSFNLPSPCHQIQPQQRPAGLPRRSNPASPGQTPQRASIHPGMRFQRQRTASVRPAQHSMPSSNAAALTRPVLATSYPVSARSIQAGITGRCATLAAQMQAKQRALLASKPAPVCTAGARPRSAGEADAMSAATQQGTWMVSAARLASHPVPASTPHAKAESVGTLAIHATSLAVPARPGPSQPASEVQQASAAAAPATNAEAGSVCEAEEQVLDIPRRVKCERRRPRRRPSTAAHRPALPEQAPGDGVEQDYREAYINQKLCRHWQAGARWAALDFDGLEFGLAKVAFHRAAYSKAAGVLLSHKGKAGAEALLATVEAEWQQLKALRQRFAALPLTTDKDEEWSDAGQECRPHTPFPKSILKQRPPAHQLHEGPTREPSLNSESAAQLLQQLNTSQKSVFALGDLLSCTLVASC